MVIENTYTIQDMIKRIKQFTSMKNSRLDEIEKTYKNNKTLSVAEIIYLKQQINYLTSGKEKYKNKIKTESLETISNVKELQLKKSDEIFHKVCVKCSTNILKKQIRQYGNTQQHGSTFMLSKKQKNALKRNKRVNLERFVQHDLSDKVCDSCYYEIIYDTRIFDVKCVKLSNQKQDIDGYIFLQDFDETKIIFGDKKGRDFKVIPTIMIKNYQIIFQEETSNYRKIRDDMSFILFNRSEKEKEKRKLPSNLDSIDSKLSELLSIDFQDGSIMNQIRIKCKNMNEIYADIESICKNKD